MHQIRASEKIVFSEEELLDELRGSMHDDNFNEVVIMAGHFMLFFDAATKRLVPGIFEDIENEVLKEQVRERVGIFPTYTWDLGVLLGDHYRLQHNKSAKLLLLVNDWQYVPDSGSAGDYRSAFYETFNALPPNYLSRLSVSNQLSEKDILPSRRHTLTFPETWLRYRFQNAATRLVKAGKLQKRFLADKPGKSEISFTDESGSSLPLISCGITGCAGEITEMISEVHRAAGRYLVILAPAECQTPIRTGIEIALSVYDLRGMKVLVTDPGGSGEMSREEIYGRGVSLASYQV
ncbi:hypothetical protein PTE30175_04665 [Pandoraea terrae]|uniref:Large polyvalent protein-associated domain-containing protein n=1 Tax=Pandoraea terrae TaxID=1537710 RepID=A0A5E4YTN3_9BURK|nr:LPD16 domain-containing protein [Pandoraea terrae]VVE52189.1 hypothetical protein PTE30175_04665 [Pandoraea terrae]